MSSPSDNNKRIAKNTLLLYFRMLLTMAVSLYTSRVVLEVLGVEDYGIYNVVGGVIVMLSFLNSSLSTATQRYMNYEMGKGNSEGLQKVFSMSFILYLIIAVIAVLIAETLGLWFVNNKLIIPEARHEAALWVYHFSVVSFAVSLLTVPYNAAIIAHERMSVYAYISVGEVIAKLLVVYLLVIGEVDKLILYAFMIMLVQGSVSLAYRTFCVRNFKECHLKWVWDKSLLKGLFSFSGWMLSGTITNMLSTQGVNILINMFFGPALNAARGIAMQVHHAVNSFVANFMTATRPQICKSFAQGDLEYMYKLVYSSSRLSFYLLFVLSLPILFNADAILSIWLKDVPEYAVIFTQLVLVDLLITASYSPIAYVSQASGVVRDYQLTISIGFVLIAIGTWLAYRLGYPVYTTFIISILVDLLGLFARLWVLNRTVGFPVRDYLRKVFKPIVLVLLCTITLSYLPHLFIENSNLISLMCNLFWCVSISIVLIWCLGMGHSEKDLVLRAIRKVIKR